MAAAGQKTYADGDADADGVGEGCTALQLQLHLHLMAFAFEADRYTASKRGGNGGDKNGQHDGCKDGAPGAKVDANA